MKKIRVVIVDDERLARDIVKNYIREHENVEIVAECENGFEGIKAINESKPDLVFLDVQMPKITGFEMLELLEHKPLIIFTTAYDQYAIKAFEVNATDYLLKPFAYDRFDEALKKAVSTLESNSINTTNTIENIINTVDQAEEYLDRVIVKFNQKINIIPVDEIIYLEAQDDYVQIVTPKVKLLKQKTMKYFEKHLNPNNFVRIHRSYIASLQNIGEIELYDKESHKAAMKNGIKLPVSKTGYAKLKEKLN